MLVKLYKIGKVHFRLFFGTNGFHVKAENERFTILRGGRKIHVVIWPITSAKCTEKRAARLFLIQPIKSLISCVVAAVPVVVSLTPWYHFGAQLKVTCTRVTLSS